MEPTFIRTTRGESCRCGNLVLLFTRVGKAPGDMQDIRMGLFQLFHQLLFCPNCIRASRILRFLSKFYRPVTEGREELV